MPPMYGRRRPMPGQQNSPFPVPGQNQTPPWAAQPIGGGFSEPIGQPPSKRANAPFPIPGQGGWGDQVGTQPIGGNAPFPIPPTGMEGSPYPTYPVGGNAPFPVPPTGMQGAPIGTQPIGGNAPFPIPGQQEPQPIGVGGIANRIDYGWQTPRIDGVPNPMQGAFGVGPMGDADRLRRERMKFQR